ncbi:hypothetical protein Tco_0328812 [Tanacetum coccineum]
MHQPWRSFAAIINKCLSGKTTALESLCLSRAKILWGMYHNKKVDYVYLLWEDLVFQVENKNSKKNNDMYYPRFTKVIVDYFVAKDQAIPRRNNMFWHYTRDDFMFTTVRVISKHQDTQVYVLYEVALSEADQMKLATKKSKKEFHNSHANGSGDGVDIQSKVPDEQQHTVSGTNEGAGDKPEVLDVPVYRSESEEESWTSSQGEDEEENDEHDNANDNDDEDDDQENDNGETESDDDGDNFVHPNLSIYKADDHEKEKEEEKANDDDEVSSDQMVSTEPDYEMSNEEENQEDDDNVMGGEQEDEEDEELYGDLNLNLDKRDAEMTNAQTNQETKEVHVTLTIEPIVVQQQSLLFSATTETPSSDTIIPQPPIPIIQSQQQTHDSTTTTSSTTTLPEIPKSTSLFSFERRVSSLETELSELKQTNQFAEALSSISGIVDNYLASKMKDAVNVAVQLQSNKLREEAHAENEEFLKQINSNIKAIIKDHVKAQVSKIMPKVEKYVTESLRAEVFARSSNQPQTSYAAATFLSEFELKKILIDKIEENKSMNRSDIQKNLYNTLIESQRREPSAGSNRGTKQRRSGKEESSKEATQKESKSISSSKGASRSQPKSSGKFAQVEEHGPRVDDLEELLHQEFNKGNDDVSPVREIIAIDERLWNPSGSQTPNHEWNKTKTVDNRPPQSWMTQLANVAGTQSSFNEFLATPVDFSAFIMNRLKLNNLTQDVLTGPTFKCMKGIGAKSVSGIGIPLRRNKVPRSIWIPAQVVYDKHAYWGTYHWGPKRQRLYGYATNMETSKDVYSRHRIIAVTSLKIMEFFGYKHLEKITVRRQDNQLYMFREGDFKRLHDMDRNHLMCTDELHKFNDSTLNHVRTALNDIATGIQMEYLPKRKWSKQDKQRARVMINAIDKKLRDRRLMRSLEKFVG